MSPFAPAHIVDMACRIPKTLHDLLLQNSVQYTVDLGSILCLPFCNLSKKYGLTVEEIESLLSLYLKIVRKYMHSTQKEFVAILSEAGFTSAFIKSIPLIYAESSVSLNVQNVMLENLKSLKWRIDIMLCDGRNQQRMRPVVMIQMSLGNGAKYLFQVDMKTFNRLRFTVCNLFNQFLNLNLRKTLL